MVALVILFLVLSFLVLSLESKPSLRGFTDETVRVVIDGVCVNNAQYGTFDFSSISLENIEKIEQIIGSDFMLYENRLCLEIMLLMTNQNLLKVENDLNVK